VSPEDEIFPQSSHKTYGLMAVVRGETHMAEKGPEDTVLAFPLLALLEGLLTLGTSLAVVAVSLLRDAPLEQLANPAVTTNPAKAPWYFVGLQEMLEHMHPTLAGIVVPGLLVAFLVVLPYLDHDAPGAGVWFGSARGRRIAWLTALYTVVLMPALIALDDALNVRESLRGLAPDFVAQWVIPGAVLALVVTLPVILLSRFKPTMREVALALFTVMLVSALVLTVSGFFFRGPGFRLFPPWRMPDGYNPIDSL
jgi:quinol-cytochrome oxidoreductase complex cytochrome b subunit